MSPEQSATFGRKARLAAVLTVEENPAAPPLCPSLFTQKEYIDWKTEAKREDSCELHLVKTL